MFYVCLWNFLCFLRAAISAPGAWLSCSSRLDARAVSLLDELWANKWLIDVTTGGGRNFCLKLGGQNIPHHFHHNSSSRTPQSGGGTGYWLLQCILSRWICENLVDQSARGRDGGGDPGSPWWSAPWTSGADSRCMSQHVTTTTPTVFDRPEHGTLAGIVVVVIVMWLLFTYRWLLRRRGGCRSEGIQHECSKYTIATCWQLFDK